MTFTVRVATSLAELIVAVLLYLWIGWEGVAAYAIGAVLIGVDRELLAHAKMNERISRLEHRGRMHG